MILSKNRQEYQAWYNLNKKLCKQGMAMCKCCTRILPINQFKKGWVCDECNQRHKVFQLGDKAL